VDERRTADLANSLGNLVSRMSSLVLNPQQRWPTQFEQQRQQSQGQANVDDAVIEAVKALPGKCDNMWLALVPG